MRLFIFVLTFIFGLVCFSQDISSANRERYFEDQFYLGITYNFIRNRPEGFNQRNLS